jgi:RNA methyltransferase, TrmH family
MCKPPDLAVKQITSRDNPLFRELLKLAGSSRQRRKSGQTLLDGAHLLAAHLDAGGQPLHVLLNGAAAQDDETVALLDRLSGVPFTQLDDRLFAQLSELKTPTGILAQIEIPQTDIATTGRFTLMLEDIQDPGNLGSMLRTAAAAGCDAVFLSKGCADAWSPRVLRAGMGGHFVLAICESADLPAVAENFSGGVYAATPGARENLYSCDLRGDIAFAVGNEGAGLSAGLLSVSRPVVIPMPGKVESLNAAAAAAVCLFEAVRQRKQGIA